MTGLYVTVPVACFRKGQAREYFETETLPPPSTCYGFLLSLCGETDRRRHIGARVTAAIRGDPEISTVVRTLWRQKSRQKGKSQPGDNARPDFQQLLTNLELIVWLDSTGEASPPPEGTLEARVRSALDPAHRASVRRFGGLSLGESTHLVNEVHITPSTGGEADDPPSGGWRVFLESAGGTMSLPIWVDHVGSRGTVHVTGQLETGSSTPPDRERMPTVRPPD
ncbi:MAG TPA: type I-MYXAN CRISPR-associated protein Cas5/Cmx5/DevS [Verrucomicrobiae bacterium]|nr:type I-MYXAN CRISPR-associated protein Cas5/Cmx5/DevS [Verrucomicrobiae bacterium]